ncbi:hypothetical protein ABZS66_20085 [Dactylosporangium sp. NPDC005572]|uniref:hypothetical protein n=1 Tax=Dactylosporangium sp. NPDC005572 TaxID=3156889 RepID=UPI0033A1BB37
MSLRLRFALGLIAVAAMLAVLVIVTRTPSEPAPQQDVVHSVTGTLGARQEVQLEVVSGAESVIIHSEAMEGYLYRASTLPGSRVEPVVEDTGQAIRLSLTGTEVAGQATVHVYLNNTVRWQLKLAGGGLRQVVDFATGRLAGIDVVAGVQELEVTVPKPEGTMPIRVGGVGRLAVHAPNGPPAQLTLGAGCTVGELRLDDQAKQNLTAGTVVAGAGWATATDRYALQVDGGAATVQLDRRPGP